YVVVVLALFVIGVVLIALHRSFWSVNGAILLVLVTIGLRPRLGRVPDRRDRVLRTSAPHLWGLVDQVAAAADAPAPDHVVLDFAYGAETFRAGRHGETTLRLGARLWLALTAPQRVALLAYLLAEQVSGDPTR